MKKISGSEAVMMSLVAEGVDTIFGYPGGAIMPIYDALYDFKDQIKHILVRHEQGASHAAEGYARMRGVPGVCFATSGPGATNLVTGIADAMLDSVPIVCITGQVASHLLGTDAFQETDIISITIPITKWNCQVTKAEDIPNAIAKAFYIANTGRPGPVLIDITKDAQIGMLDYEYKKITNLPTVKIPGVPDEKDILAASELINNAKKPLILAGHGVLIANAQSELVEFSNKTGIPVACTLHGLSSFPTGHKNYIGMLGMHGNYGANFLTNDADVIIAVGMRFDDRVTGTLSTYLPQSKVIHIEVDPAEIAKNVKPEVSLISDAKRALTALLNKVKANNHNDWINSFRDCDEQENQKVINPAVNYSGDMPRMIKTIDVISKKTKGKAVIVAHVGQHQMIAARYYKFDQPNSFVTSGGLGTMGFALPAALGCKVASPKREVVAIIGDGSFQMTLQEMAVLAQDNIAVKVVVLNNNFLGMVRQWQELFFDKRYSFVDLVNPNFIKLAEGFGIPARQVTDNKDLESAVDEMLAAKTPFFLEVVVEKEDNVFPMVPAGCGVKDVRLE